MSQRRMPRRLAAKQQVDVSIIIPALNEAALLPKLLASIGEQTVRPREVIVADARSTDATAHLAQANGARVVVGGNPATSRNNGAAAAKGSYLLFLDADIVLPPTFLAVMLEEFEREYYEIATAPFVPDSTLRIDYLTFAFQERAMALLGEFYPFAHGPIILTTARLHRRLGGFRTDLKLGEDTDYGQRAKQLAKFGVITATHATISIRRLEKEGRLALLRKYLRHGILTHLEPLGITADVDYDFGQFNRVKSLSAFEALFEEFLRLFPAPSEHSAPYHGTQVLHTKRPRLTNRSTRIKRQ